LGTPPTKKPHPHTKLFNRIGLRPSTALFPIAQASFVTTSSLMQFSPPRHFFRTCRSSVCCFFSLTRPPRARPFESAVCHGDVPKTIPKVLSSPRSLGPAPVSLEQSSLAWLVAHLLYRNSACSLLFSPFPALPSPFLFLWPFRPLNFPQMRESSPWPSPLLLDLSSSLMVDLFRRSLSLPL